MSFDQSINHRKEHRKPYYDSRRWDRTCRNHGSCGWCYSNRLFSSTRSQFRVQDELEDWNIQDPEDVLKEDALDVDVEQAIFGE